jgi:hypothetical protein
MPLVRIIVRTKLVAAEPENTGMFAGCPRTTCRQLSRRQHLDHPCPQTIELYGETYEVNGSGRRLFNRKHPDRDLYITLDDDKFEQFVAKAKAAGHHWKTDRGGSTDARRLFPQLAIHI